MIYVGRSGVIGGWFALSLLTNACTVPSPQSSQNGPPATSVAPPGGAAGASGSATGMSAATAGTSGNVGAGVAGAGSGGAAIGAAGSAAGTAGSGALANDCVAPSASELLGSWRHEFGDGLYVVWTFSQDPAQAGTQGGFEYVRDSPTACPEIRGGTWVLDGTSLSIDTTFTTSSSSSVGCTPLAPMRAGGKGTICLRPEGLQLSFDELTSIGSDPGLTVTLPATSYLLTPYTVPSSGPGAALPPGPGGSDPGLPPGTGAYPCQCPYAPIQATTFRCSPNSCETRGGTCCPAGTSFVTSGGHCHDQQLSAYELCQGDGGLCPQAVICH